MESAWPVRQNRLRKKWDSGSRTQGYKVRNTHCMVGVANDVPIAPTQLAHRTCAKCLRGLSHARRQHKINKLVLHQHRILYERQNATAQLEMHMYGFRIILKNTFAPGDLDTVINQLVFQSQGDLGQFVDNRDLFIRVDHLLHLLLMMQAF